MSNLHAAGLDAVYFQVPVTALATGTAILYGGEAWTVAEVLSIHTLGDPAVIAVNPDGMRMVLLYANPNALAEVVSGL